MKVTPAALPEVVVLEPTAYADERGHVFEAFHAEKFAAAELPSSFVQENLSRSRKATLRGLHYQLRAQGKLVRAVRGEIFDVAVDLRRASPTFGRWAGERLSGENRRAMWIPPGFAHGFYVLSEADVLYQLTAPWAADLERIVRWDDPEIAIAWPLDGAPILSPKDADAPPLSRAELP